jgi:hypothetical protein
VSHIKRPGNTGVVSHHKKCFHRNCPIHCCFGRQMATCHAAIPCYVCTQASSTAVRLDTAYMPCMRQQLHATPGMRRWQKRAVHGRIAVLFGTAELPSTAQHGTPQHGEACHAQSTAAHTIGYPGVPVPSSLHDITSWGFSGSVTSFLTRSMCFL